MSKTPFEAVTPAQKMLVAVDAYRKELDRLEAENAALRNDKEQMRDALQTALGSLCSAAIREGVGKHIEAVLSNTKEAQP